MSRRATKAARRPVHAAKQAATVTKLVTPRTLLVTDMKRSGLVDEIDLLHVEPFDAATGAARVGAKLAAGRPGARFPYFNANGTVDPEYYRDRFYGEGGPKYVGPAGALLRAYLAPLLDQGWDEIQADPTVDVAVTEGEKKSACACKHGIPTIGLGGVDCFSAKKHGIDFIPDLEDFEWKGRRVTIIFDADIARKPEVRSAMLRLAAELIARGARVHVGHLDPDGPKGIDDLVVARGSQALEAVIDAAEPLREGEWPIDLPLPVRMFPHVARDAKGNAKHPIATIENVEALGRGYGFKFGYDVITKTALLAGRGIDTGAGAGVAHGALDVAHNRIVSQARLCGIPSANEIPTVVTGIAYANPVNPVVAHLEALPAPGRGDHILAVARRIIVPAGDEAIRDAVVRLWLIEACAAADHAARTPNRDARPTFEYVLTLLGAQGVAKTSSIRAIVPQALRRCFGSGINLNPDSKDSVERATGFWIAELGEVDATFSKSAIASLKAFLSQSVDVYRKSYGRERNSFPRHTVFAATGNVLRSLRDITGSRRFWPLNVSKVDPILEAEVDRMWAQAWRLYLAGEQWWPTPGLQRRLDAQSEDYAEEFPLGEQVIEHFGPLTAAAKKERGVVLLTAFEILKAVDAARQRDAADPRDVGAARALGTWLTRANVNERGEPDRFRRGNSSVWRMPKPKGPKW